MNIFFALAAGCAADLAIGDPEGLLHPICAIGRLIAALEKLLRRLFPPTQKGELAAGTVLAVTVPLVSFAVPFALLWGLGRLNVWLAFAAQCVMAWQLVAGKCLEREGLRVYRALTQGTLADARAAVGRIVGRDTGALSAEGVTKAAVETIAENTSDGVIAPMLFFALGGAPLGFLYKAINTMDSMVGYKNEKYLYFGRAAAKLDDAANLLPARLSALLMIAAAWLLRFDAKNAARIWRRDRRNHKSPNSAQTESVCAGALGVQLAGNAYYFGELYEKPTIGDPARPIEPQDIRRAAKLMYGTAALCLVLIGGVYALAALI